MRLAWCSPTAGNSGIVDYTRQIVPQLIALGAEVDVFTPRAPQDPPAGAGIVDYGGAPELTEHLPDYDAIVYNIGNHLGFHRDELELSRRYPGVVILHDRTLHHLWAGWYVAHGARGMYSERMRALYGERGAQVAEAVLAERGAEAWDPPEEVLGQSFTADTLTHAVGAVVHCREQARGVAREWSGPLCALDFPAYSSQLVRRPLPAPPVKATITALSVGHVDGHKQIHATVQALAADPALAARMEYVILGGYDPRAAYIRDLHRLIADGGLAGRVHLLGYQPDATLQRHLAEADLFVNLRWPNLEGGSASLTEQLAHGRPVIVTDAGSFAELPDDAVVKVAPEDAEGLSQALRALCDDSDLRARLGAAARRCAEQRDPVAYATALLEFVDGARATPGRRALAAATGAALRFLHRDGDADLRAVAAEIDAML